MKNFSFTFTRRNFAFLGLCLGGLALLFLIGIVPLIAQEKSLEKNIPETKAKLAHQAQLKQILQAADAKLESIETMDNLPLITPESLSIIESSSVMSRIASLAKQKKITLISIAPQIPGSSENLKELVFESHLQGQLTNIRSFIYSLLQVPYIQQIDKLRIQSSDGILNLDLSFSVRIT